VIEVQPAPVTAAWLAGKLPELRAGKGSKPAPLATAIVEALTKAGILGADGKLKVRDSRLQLQLRLQ
jgi:hypothetical protein